MRMYGTARLQSMRSLSGPVGSLVGSDTNQLITRRTSELPAGFFMFIEDSWRGCSGTVIVYVATLGKATNFPIIDIFPKRNQCRMLGPEIGRQARRISLRRPGFK